MDPVEALMEILQQINDLSGGALEMLSQAQGGGGGAGPEGGGAPPEEEVPAPPAGAPAQ